MTLKRSYEITPLDVGHPLYFENPTISRYEVIIKQGNNYAIVYVDLSKEDCIIDILEELDKLSWLALDALSRYSMYYLSRASLFTTQILTPKEKEYIESDILAIKEALKMR